MDSLIFSVGVFISVLVVVGLILTVSEFRRFEREGTKANPRFPL